MNVCKVCEALGITTDDLEEMVNGIDKKTIEPTYEDVEELVARNGKKMTVEYKYDKDGFNIISQTETCN